MTYSLDDLSGTKQAAELTLERAKDALKAQLSPADYEVKRDECTDMASAVSSITDFFDDEMEKLRKQKRAIDDAIADRKREQRPFKALHEDLREHAKRLNNAFFDSRRELQSRNVRTYDSPSTSLP